jgi:hypothetical protein
MLGTKGIPGAEPHRLKRLIEVLNEFIRLAKADEATQSGERGPGAATGTDRRLGH